MIFTGKKMVHSALAAAFGHTKRRKNAPSALRAIAIVQEGAFLRLGGRPIFEVPPGLATREAVQQIKQEMLEAATQMMIEIKFRNHKRRCRQTDAKHLSKKITVRELVRKAVPGWKRAAYHRTRKMMPVLSQRRAKKQVDLTKLGVPSSS